MENKWDQRSWGYVSRKQRLNWNDDIGGDGDMLYFFVPENAINKSTSKM